MTKFEEVVAMMQNAGRGNFVLSHAQRKILLEGIKLLQKQE